MNKEKIYTFNEYVLGYDKGNNDRSCLTISKIQNGNMYVMSSLYDGSADVISMMLDNLQQENFKMMQENKQLKELCTKYEEELNLYKEQEEMNYLIEQEEVFNDYSFMEENNE